MQNEPTKTGNGREKQENLKFPVTFELKVVLETNAAIKEQQNNIETILQELQISNAYKNHKMSTKGTYCSYTYQVKVQSREQLQQMYTGLKLLNGFKFAL